MKTPFILVNFKNYERATGQNAEKLALICDKVAKETGASVAVAVSALSISRISGLVSIPVFAQHMDDITFGSHTGKLLAEDIKHAGAYGCILNHSEDRYRMDHLEAAIIRAREIGLISIVCANDAGMAEAIAAWKPDFIAVEPPELIGGTISIATARPGLISETIDKVHKVEPVPVVCGAGVNSRLDVETGLKLGAVGFLLASAVAKADDPEQVLRDLVSGFD